MPFQYVNKCNVTDTLLPHCAAEGKFSICATQWDASKGPLLQKVRRVSCFRRLFLLVPFEQPHFG